MKSLKLHSIKGDGNCLFRSLSHQLYSTEERYQQIRQSVCQYMASHPDDFIPFLDDISLTEHLSRMRKDATFGTNLELVAFANAYHCIVQIHQEDTKPFVIIPTLTKQKKVLAVYYHSWEHYDSVIEGSEVIRDASSIQGAKTAFDIDEVTSKLQITALGSSTSSLSSHGSGKKLRSRERKEQAKKLQKQRALEKKRQQNLFNDVKSNAVTKTAETGDYIPI